MYGISATLTKVFPLRYISCARSSNFNAVLRSLRGTRPSAYQARQATNQSSLLWPPQLGGYQEVIAQEDAPEWYTKNKQRLCIIDAMPYIHKAHHAYRDQRLLTSKNEDTTVLYGFLMFLLSILEMQPSPTHLLVAFDAPGATFRHDIAGANKCHVDDIKQFIETRGQSNPPAADISETLQRKEIYPAYKGQRPETPDEIKDAVPKVIEFLGLMGVKVLKVHGIEADDVCGTVASRSIAEGMLAFVFTSDMDFYQLIQPNLMLMRGPVQSVYKLHTESTFSEQFPGLTPRQYIELRALSGDTSDNIPGVAGVGEKTALKLIQEYLDVEGVIESAKSKTIKENKRIKELFTEEGWNAARISRQLVEIQTKLHMPDIRFDMEECLLKTPLDNGEQLLKALDHYEFSKFKSRLVSVVHGWNQGR